MAHSELYQDIINGCNTIHTLVHILNPCVNNLSWRGCNSYQFITPEYQSITPEYRSLAFEYWGIDSALYQDGYGIVTCVYIYIWHTSLKYNR